MLFVVSNRGIVIAQYFGISSSGIILVVDMVIIIWVCTVTQIR